LSEYTLYLGDCLDFMHGMDAGSIDMAFLDPPFNKGKRYLSYRDKRIDYWEWTEAWFSEVVRLLKPEGSLYFMHITDGLANVLALIGKLELNLQNVIPWKNAASVHTKTKFIRCYQPIVFATKNGRHYFDTYYQTNPNAIKSWSKDRRDRQRGQLLDIWDDIPRVYAGSVVHKEAVLLPGTRKKAHLCQMPIGLASRAIGFSCPPNGMVFDPFMGSGTTGVACVPLGRNFIGCEIDPSYYAIAERRINESREQLTLI
jgi:site-specific DNA-methyltransferase (adenine-specific)